MDTRGTRRANEALEVLRDEAEGVRVAYVAATRARDLLVVPVVGDVEWDAGWISPLNAAVYPPMDARRSASTASYHPPFKKDSVFKRPDDDPFTNATVQPGVHRFGEGDEAVLGGVVGPACAAARRGSDRSACERETLIMKDVPPSVVDEGLRDYERWQSRLGEAIAAGVAPSLSVRTATEWAADANADLSCRSGWQSSRRLRRCPHRFSSVCSRSRRPPAQLCPRTLEVVDRRRA